MLFLSQLQFIPNIQIFHVELLEIFLEIVVPVQSAPLQINATWRLLQVSLLHILLQLDQIRNGSLRAV